MYFIFAGTCLLYVVLPNLFLYPFHVELFYDRGNHHEFTSLVKELAKPGDLTTKQTYDFEFVNVEKPYETYTGANVRLR